MLGHAGFGLWWGDLEEGLRSGGFALDRMLPEDRDSAMAGYQNKSYVEERQGRTNLKL